jgi:hypothetical protein
VWVLPSSPGEGAENVASPSSSDEREKEIWTTIIRFLLLCFHNVNENVDGLHCRNPEATTASLQIAAAAQSQRSANAVLMWKCVAPATELWW